MSFVRPEWKRNVGIEMTWTTRTADDSYFRAWFDKDMKAMRIALAENGFKFCIVHPDGPSLEVSSSVITSWEEAEKIRLVLDAAAKKEKLVARNDQVVCGGGHIHIDLDILTKLKLFRDYSQKPYIMWAFNDYSDIGGADALSRGGWREENHAPLYKFVKPGSRADKYLRNGTDKSYGVNFKWYGVELRFFRSAWDWEEQEEHLIFAQAYMEWLSTQELRRVERKNPDWVRAWTYEDASAAFMNLIRELKLPMRRYEKYVENMWYRFQLGKEYLC